jgi:hypothetical protein
MGRVFSRLNPEFGPIFQNTEPKEAPMVEEDDDEEYTEENTPDLNYLAEYGVDSVLISDQNWEDKLAIMNIRSKYPYPHILKVINYTPATLKDQEEWLTENCRAEWKRIGWQASCAYTVAIGFTNHIDAVLYRLRWN